jgi:hypothetical protein
MKQIAVPPGHALAPRGWQPKFGVVLLLLAVLSPLLAPLVLAMDLTEEVRRPLAGLLLFGVPMALILAVVALIGQPAFEYIHRRTIWGSDGEPVGLTRYRVGLVMVVVAVVVSWIEPLVSARVPEFAERRVLVGALTDGVVLAGLFVLGGEFWDKVHALFVHDARVLPDPQEKAPVAEAVQVGWRFYAGIAILVCSFGAWSLVPIASAAGWSTAQIATLSGAIFIGSKVGLITAIAVMGKAGFNYTKLLVFGFVSKFGPAQQVSPARYRLGLVLFVVPFLMTWLAPYATGLARPIGIYGFLQNLALEALVLVGLYLLGGEFWDKVRALFRHRARVEIPRNLVG